MNMLSLPDQTRAALSGFDSVSLEEMDNVSLQDRLDTKFVFPAAYLSDILLAVSDHYRVMQIGTERLFAYESVYYDTPDLKCYLMHHNLRPARFKIRLRKYLDSGIGFIEVKSKKKGRTIKNRVKLSEENPFQLSDHTEFIESLVPAQLSEMQPTLAVMYHRFTITDREFQERATLDLNLLTRNLLTGREAAFPDLIIAEVKQPHFSRQSPLIRQLLDRHIIPMRFSKYCTGILNCFPGVKYNRFKKNAIRLEKILHSQHP